MQWITDRKLSWKEIQVAIIIVGEMKAPVIGRNVNAIGTDKDPDTVDNQYLGFSTNGFLQVYDSQYTIHMLTDDHPIITYEEALEKLKQLK